MRDHASTRLRTLGAAALALSLAACGGHGGKPASGSKAAGLALTEDGVAGVTMNTLADEATVGALVAGAAVRRDADNTDMLEVWRGDERLFYVVAIDARRPERGVFNVHVTSSTIAGPNGWRVGGTVGKDAKFDVCECWGGELAVCYRNGAHVALAFDQQECDELPTGDGVVGKPIVRMVWNPLPWPQIRQLDEGGAMPCGEPDGMGGDPCGE